MAHNMKSPAEIAATFGCTVEQARAQLRANASDLRRLHAQAVAKGGKLRGLTADQWQERAEAFARAADK